MKRALPLVAGLASALVLAATSNAIPARQAYGLNCGHGFTAELVPLILHRNGHLVNVHAYPFAKACTKHDACYARWQGPNARTVCDSAFGNDMNNICKTRPRKLRADCDYVAKEYHGAVLRHGAAYYRQGQLSALNKVAAGSYPFSSVINFSDGGSLPLRGTITLDKDPGNGFEGMLTLAVTFTATDPAPGFTQDLAIDFTAPTVTMVAHMVTAPDFADPDTAGQFGNYEGEFGINLSWYWGGAVLAPQITGTVVGYGMENTQTQSLVDVSGNIIADKTS